MTAPRGSSQTPCHPVPLMPKASGKVQASSETVSKHVSYTSPCKSAGQVGAGRASYPGCAPGSHQNSRALAGHVWQSQPQAFLLAFSTFISQQAQRSLPPQPDARGRLRQKGNHENEKHASEPRGKRHIHFFTSRGTHNNSWMLAVVHPLGINKTEL